jgi:hypothetical protein
LELARQIEGHTDGSEDKHLPSAPPRALPDLTAALDLVKAFGTCPSSDPIRQSWVHLLLIARRLSALALRSVKEIVDRRLLTDEKLHIRVQSANFWKSGD